MIEVIKYTAEKKKQWDEFVDKAKNGAFLFKRDYMEYHSDRFEDYSLMLYERKKLKVIFPANRINDILYSHQGLTFGGLVTLYSDSSIQIISYFNAINLFLTTKGITSVYYKSIPQIYKTHFGQEEDYMLFRLNAKLVSCNLSAVLDMSNEIIISRNRNRNHKKAKDNNVIILESENYRGFWEIMISNLEDKFNAKPVHSLQEIILLVERFPNNIKLFIAQKDDMLIGGAVLFLFKDVIKVQYAHASSQGKQLGAIDAIYFYIIHQFRSQFKYIDFGSSNMESGKVLQDSLVAQKEGFGARGVVNRIFSYQSIVLE